MAKWNSPNIVLSTTSMIYKPVHIDLVAFTIEIWNLVTSNGSSAYYVNFEHLRSLTFWFYSIFLISKTRICWVIAIEFMETEHCAI